MKLSIPACIFPVIVCVFLDYHNPEGGKLVPPLCPGNIVIDWQQKEEKNRKTGITRKNKNL